MKTDKQKGVSLIITFFIMVIILAVVLSISALLYSEVKIVRNIGNSVVSFYAADSGVEKVLYYDRQVKPPLVTNTTCDPIKTCTTSGQTCVDGFCTFAAARGLCSMYEPSVHDSKVKNGAVANANFCAQQPTGLAADSSIYCNNVATPTIYVTSPPITIDADAQPGNSDGCTPSLCNDCQISFETNMDNNAQYTTTARIYPLRDGSSNFVIESKGLFGGTGRQVQVSTPSAKSKSAIEITYVCANPESAPQGGQAIEISANILANNLNDPIGTVTAVIYDAQGKYYDINGNVTSQPKPCNTTANCSAATACNSSSSCHEVCNDKICQLPLSLYAGTGYNGYWDYLWVTKSATLAKAYYVDIDIKDTIAVPNDKKCISVSPYPQCFSEQCNSPQ